MKITATLFDRATGSAGFLCGLLGLAGVLIAPASNFPLSLPSNPPMKNSASPLPQITLARPLVDLDVAGAALGKSRKQIHALIAARQLQFVFDLGLGSRGEFRVLASEVARAQGCPLARVPDFATALGIIFPCVPSSRVGVVATIPANTVGANCSLSMDHVAALIREGQLSLAPGAVARRGPGGSPKVTFSSVAALLKRSRIA